MKKKSWEPDLLGDIFDHIDEMIQERMITNLKENGIDFHFLESKVNNNDNNCQKYDSNPPFFVTSIPNLSYPNISTCSHRQFVYLIWKK